MSSKLTLYIAKASKLYEAGKYAKSLDYFNEAIKFDPKNSELYHKRGLALKEIKEFDAALKDFENAISLKEDNAAAYLNAGDILCKTGRWQEAIGCYDKAISFDPDNAEAFCNKALSLEEIKKYDEALQCYDKAIALAPAKIDFYHYKGILLEDLKKYEEAFKYYNKAIELDPDNAETYHLKGDLLIELEKLQEALECITQSIKLNPNNKDLYDKKGWILETLGKDREAIKYYDESIKLDPTLDYPYYNKARIYAVLNEKQLAIQNLEKAIELNPENRKKARVNPTLNIIRKEINIPKKRNPWIAVLLSSFIPGLGQVYNGQMKKGIGLCLLLFSEIFIMNILGKISPLKALIFFIHFLFSLIMLITFIYIIIEAFITARKVANSFILRPYNRWYIYLIIYIIYLILPDPKFEYGYKTYKIPAESMQPTLDIGDHLVVNKFSYLKTSPKRGDLNVFKYPGDKRRDFIKRVIGLPEEKIMIKNQKVYINGKELKEPYVIHTDIHSELQSQRDNWGKPITIPANHYFVLGDNRDSSYDSRFWGTVHEELIRGEVCMIYWPPWRIKELE